MDRSNCGWEIYRSQGNNSRHILTIVLNLFVVYLERIIDVIKLLHVSFKDVIREMGFRT